MKIIYFVALVPWGLLIWIDSSNTILGLIASLLTGIQIIALIVTWNNYN